MYIRLNLAKLMKENKLTTSDLHRLTGVRYKTLRDYHNDNVRKLDLDVLEAYARVLGFENVSRFLTVEEGEPPKGSRWRSEANDKEAH